MFSKLKEVFSRKNKLLAVEKPSSTEAMSNALTLLNCTFNIDSNENKDQVIYFKYQGLNFRAFTFGNEDNTDCNLDFHAGAYPFSDLEFLRQTTNSANSSVSPVHFYFVSDAQENVFNLYASSTLTNVPEIEDLKDTLSKTLETFFYAQRNFDENIKKKREEKIADEETLHMNLHEIWMAREMEIALQPKSQLTANSDARNMLLTDFLEDAYQIQSVEIESIDICNRDRNIRITDTERIHSLKLIDPIITKDDTSGEYTDAYDTATITVLYLQPSGEMRSIMLSLRIENKLKQAIYFRVTALREGDCIAMDSLWGNTRNMPHALSMLLAVENGTDARKKAEVKYMWNETQKKVENGEQLSDDEEYLLRISSVPQLADNAYWGRKHFNQKRYAEALKHFLNAHEYLEKHFFDDFWNDAVREYFARNSWYIGFCYCELSQPALGVHYAEKANLIYPCPVHQMTLIKAMFLADDFRIFHEINTRIAEIEELNSKLKEEEPVPEAQAEMYDFLQSSYVLALIKHRKWNDAKLKLENIIENANDPGMKEWAQKKLEEIKKKK